MIGMMATMHQKKCPLTSGRFVLWRTIPFLLISPIITTFVNGHDVLIYLIVLYSFLLLLLYQYRNLCHEWSTWISKIPHFKEDDIGAWYSNKQPFGPDREKSDKGTDGADRSAILAFREDIQACRVGSFKSRKRGATDDLVAKVGKALPLILWLVERNNEANGKINPNAKPEELFSKSWFAQLEQALERQQDLARGLKEHSIFVLFRHGEYDVSTKRLKFGFTCKHIQLMLILYSWPNRLGSFSLP
jgi:hypothetical protein